MKQFLSELSMHVVWRSKKTIILKADKDGRSNKNKLWYVCIFVLVVEVDIHQNQVEKVVVQILRRRST